MEGLVLVTDAISALGLEEGVHQLGQFEIEIRKGSPYIAGTDTLCGSVAEMSKCVRHFKEATGKFYLDFFNKKVEFYKYIYIFMCKVFG